MRSPFLYGLAAVCVCQMSAFRVPAAPRPATPHDLTFEERVRAQEAIERVYYSHQIAATRPFEEAVPREVIESKVRRYLKLSVALERFWSTPVTAEMLDGESLRIAAQTRMPERLREIQAALGDDPVLFEECYARQAIVERLARDSFASDRRLQAGARAEAENLREHLVSGALSPEVAHPRRSVVILRQSIASRSAVRRQSGAAPLTLELSPDEFRGFRAQAPAEAGVIGPVTDHRDAFTVSVLLAERDETAEIATFEIPKLAWSDWWDGAAARFDETAARQVVHAGRQLPLPTDRPTASGTGAPNCAGSWENRGLDNFLDARSGHTAVWTGTQMIIWGGYVGDGLDTGGRYDPAADTWAPVSTAGAPTPRGRHTAVWTGTQMIVWGGLSGNSVLHDTGGRYDPTTDTWSPVATTGAPAARWSHTAVWTGSLMVIWGGTGASSSFDTGGRYDPGTNSWTSTSTLDAPAGRFQHTAIWTGTQMIVWGGGGFGLNTGGRYDPGADTWASMSSANAPTGRTNHTAVWTGTRMILWGGFGDSISLNTGSQYDPATDTWSATSLINAPSARSGHTAVWTGTRMIVWGTSSLGTGGRYDPVMNTWSPTSTTSVPERRSGHTAVWTGTQMIVWGGQGQFYLDTGGRYDANTDTWAPTATTSIPGMRLLHTAVWTGTQMIVWGGQSQFSYLNTGGRYDPTAATWTATSTTNAPAPRDRHTAVWTGTEMIVWGGRGSAGNPGNTGGRYNPTTDTWTPTPATGAPTGRQGHTAVWTGTEMIIWGGNDNAGDADTGGRYNPAANTWSPTSQADSPGGRSAHTAVWTGTHMIVWGGSSLSESGLNTGGLYDPVWDTWYSMSVPSDVPARRQGHSAVWTGSLMIVWGGENFFYYNTGALYDPSSDNWATLSTINAPTARAFHTAVWDGTQMVVWGGYDNVTGATNTGSLYDLFTDTWRSTTTTGAPEARDAHSAVWTGTQLIVWGGSRDAPGYGLLSSGGLYTPGQITDACDPNDGNILVWLPDGATVEWQQEAGFEAFNVYLGDLAVLKTSGIYTQDPGTVPLAGRACGLVGSTTPVVSNPPPGKGVFFLVTGVHLGVEGSLGTNSAGVERPNDHPCP